MARLGGGAATTTQLLSGHGDRLAHQWNHEPAKSSPQLVADRIPSLLYALVNIRRPAEPRRGLSSASQIARQIEALESISQFNRIERLAIVSDVASHLPSIGKVIQKRGASRGLAVKARKLTSLLKAATVAERDNLQDTLLVLANAVFPDDLTRSQLENNVSTVEAFVRLVEPFANEVGLHEQLCTLTISIIQQYLHLLPETESGHSPLSPNPSNFSLDTEGTSQLLVPPKSMASAWKSGSKSATLPEWKDLPEIDENLDIAATLEMLRSIDVYLAEWCSVNARFYAETVEAFLPHASTIIRTLEGIDSLNNRTFSSKHIRNALADCSQNWSTFAHTWGTAAEDAIAEKLLLLLDQTRAFPSQIPESVFTTVVGTISALSRRPPLGSVGVTDNTNGGLVIGQKFASRAEQFCDLLHHTWQTVAYQSELHRLWLLIWRSLKAIYRIRMDSNVLVKAEEAFIDAIFFEDPETCNAFELLLNATDAANPRRAEDMVARYCRLIAKCRADPDNEYQPLRRYEETELQPHLLRYLEAFIATGQAEMNLLQKLHRAVVRFNFITNGAATVRRWAPDSSDQEWIIEPLGLVSPTKAFAPSPSSPTFLHHEMNSAVGDTTKLAALPHPLGVNVRSAFDYVFFPVPETRAHEIAQSARISRDLRDPGIVSEGVRVEDLINLPPRHTRGPASVSRFEWPTFVTPPAALKTMSQQVISIGTALRQRFRSTSRKNPARHIAAKGGKKTSSEPWKKHRAKQLPLTTPSVGLRGGAGDQDEVPDPEGQFSSHETELNMSFSPITEQPPEPSVPPQRGELGYSGWCIDEFVKSIRPFEAPEDALILAYLNEAEWVVERAKQHFECVQDFKNDDPNRAQFPDQDILEYLKSQYWDYRAAGTVYDARREALLEFRDGLPVQDRTSMTMRRCLDFLGQLIEMYPEISVSDPVALAKFALAEWDRERAANIAEFRRCIVYGDNIRDDQIVDHHRRYKYDLNLCVAMYLQMRQHGAPCVLCPVLLHGVHHNCQCAEHPPSWLAQNGQPQSTSNQENQPPNDSDQENQPPNSNQENQPPNSNQENQPPNTSNQGNQPPASAHVDYHTCHACPYFPGEYHHRHTPNVVEVVTHDATSDTEPTNLPAYLNRPERQNHPQDAELLVNAIGNYGQLYSSLRDLSPEDGGENLSGLAFLIGPNGFGVAMEFDSAVLVEISKRIEEVTENTKSLLEVFAGNFDQPVPMDAIQNPIIHRRDRKPKPTIELCLRTAQDLLYYQQRMLSVVGTPNRPQPPYCVLTLRHELGRFVRTLNELRSLYVDYVMQVRGVGHDLDPIKWTKKPEPTYQGDDGTTNDQMDTSDSEADQSISSDADRPEMTAEEAWQRARPQLPNYKPRRLPQAADYEKMFVDELDRELLKNRGVSPQDLARYPNKAARIQLLLELDRRGVYGQGARNGYRAITGKLRGARERQWADHLERNLAAAEAHRMDLWRQARERRRMGRGARNFLKKERNERKQRLREEAIERGHVSGEPDAADISDNEILSSESDDNDLPSVSDKVPSAGGNDGNGPSVGPNPKGNVARDQPRGKNQAPPAAKGWKKDSRGRLKRAT